MKKIIAFALVILMISALAITFASCKKTPSPIVTDDGEEIEIIPAEDYTPAPSAPGSSPVFTRTKVALDGEPAYENGTIVLHFKDTVIYDKNTACYVGYISDNEADTTSASPEMDACADMAVDGGYNGVALKLSSAIPAGEYRFSIQLDTYIVDTFDLTID